MIHLRVILLKLSCKKYCTATILRTYTGHNHSFLHLLILTRNLNVNCGLCYMHCDIYIQHRASLTLHSCFVLFACISLPFLFGSYFFCVSTSITLLHSRNYFHARRPEGFCSSNMGSSRSDSSAKERLKWTQELHDLFEKAVNQLGGPYSKCGVLFHSLSCMPRFYPWLIP